MTVEPGSAVVLIVVVGLVVFEAVPSPIAVVRLSLSIYTPEKYQSSVELSPRRRTPTWKSALLVEVLADWF